MSHNRFKVFSAPYLNGTGLPNLLREIEEWVRANKVAPRSIGVEYLEGRGRLVMSVGYSLDEAYSIRLSNAGIGNLDLDAGFEKIEEVMAEQAGLLTDVICHELFVTEDNFLTMIFMSRA